MVQHPWGDKLMQEIEASERRKAKIRAILDCQTLAEDQWEKEVAELRTLFPEVPLRLLEQIPGEKNYDKHQLPFNRKMRKRIEKAKHINMYSGADASRWKSLESNEVVVINIDILDLNVMDPNVAGWVDSLIKTGRVKMWTGGPPCQTRRGTTSTQDSKR